MIQCVGSRTPDRPNCSRICCSVAVKNALKLKELAPLAEITVLYRDIRTYGFMEHSYKAAREKGVRFVPYAAEAKPELSARGDALELRVRDSLIGEEVAIAPDLVVLSSAVVPHDNAPLAKMLKVPLTAEGFFLEAHMKLRPVDFATDGVFLAGMAHFPKTIDETIAQAGAAVARATAVIAKGSIGILPTISCGGSEPVRRVRPLRIPLPVQRHPRRGDRRRGRSPKRSPHRARGAGSAAQAARRTPSPYAILPMRNCAPRSRR